MCINYELTLSLWSFLIEKSGKVIQEYDKYTEEDFNVWKILFDEQMQQLPKIASNSYLQGLEKVQFKNTKIPNFKEVNKLLGEETGWSIHVVPGIIDTKPFFVHLSNQEFPATTWLRKMSQLKYIQEPDMFHDVFGHVPVLSDPVFCQYLKGLSKIALDYIDNQNVLELMARIYWFTVEFGLIKEDGIVKIYGAGLISSPGESLFSLSSSDLHRPFTVKDVLSTSYFNDRYQIQYFVAESYDQMYEALDEIRTEIERYVAEGIVVKPAYAQ